MDDANSRDDLTKEIMRRLGVCDETALMNWLQDHNIISDEAVNWCDVPESDRLQALRVVKLMTGLLFY